MGLFSIFSRRSERSGAQADTPLPVSVPYELRRGGTYLFEVKQWAGPRRQWNDLTEYYREVHDIDIIFVPTAGDFVGIYPVLPAEVKKQLSQRLPQAKANTKPQKNAKAPNEHNPQLR